MSKKIIAVIIACAILIPILTSCSAVTSPASTTKMQNQSPAATTAGTAKSAPEQNVMGDSDDYSTETTEQEMFWAPDDATDNTAEEYNEIVENSYLPVSKFPLSTFSADVDTASYTNIRRMINEESAIPADAVRIEEMINYFNYDYPEPEGDDLFSVTRELADCPWNNETKLLMVGIQAKNIQYDKLPASNFVFLLDVSGSMADSDKLPLVIEAMKLLTENLREEDRISIVTYAGNEAVLLDGTSGEDKDEIIDVLDSLEAGGSTNGSAGIDTAYELAQEHFIEGGNNRVILATDGDLNVGITSEDDLTDLIIEQAESGVFLSVLGFGTGNIKDNKMEALADNGNGNFSYIDSILEAKKVLVEEMGGTLFTIAKDVKFQVEFNPEQVKGYRLVGYENRLMEAEDFSDDTKDAGEVGAGLRVTVLYEIVLPDSEINIPESTLKYQSDTTTEESVGSDEWLTVSIRYKLPDGDESKLEAYPVTDEYYSNDPSENLQFAACIAQFGMILRGSEYVGTASFDSIIETLSELYCVRVDEYKDEFFSLVKKMARY